MKQPARLVPVTSVPIFDGRQWDSIAFSPYDAATATRGERDGFVVVDRQSCRVGLFWFFWCEVRNRPAIVVTWRGRRADVTMDLYCTDRCLTPDGWEAVVAAYQRHGSNEMARVARRGLAFPVYVYGTVPLHAAEPLAHELLAISDTPRLTVIVQRPPSMAKGGRP